MATMVNMHLLLAQAGADAGNGAFLVSWWKPLVLLAMFAPWAWIVATIYDKDAKQWLLGVGKWNAIHVASGLLAWAGALASPSFLIAAPVFLLVLTSDIFAYRIAHNKSERVPESARWRFNLDGLKQMLAKKKDESVITKGLVLGFRGPDGLARAPEKETPEYEVRLAAETVVNDAIDARASRFDIAPTADKKYGVSFIIDGVRKTSEPMHAGQGVAVIDFFKRVAGLDVDDRRRRHVADLRIERQAAKRDIRLTTLGDARGQRLQGVFDPEKQVSLVVDDLGLLPKQREAMDALLNTQEGVVLLGTPPLNGRTTLLYAVLRGHDAYLCNIQTVEIQPEMYLDGVRHNQFNPLEEGADYATTVRSILRRDPDIVAVAELPDASTAETIATVADHDSTRVYLCIKADNALNAIAAYVKAVEGAKKAAGGMHGVVIQRLIRKLCDNCKAEYAPTADILRKLNLPADKVKRLYKKGGQVLRGGKPEVCTVCSGLGYFGQTGLHEVFAIGEEEREAIAQEDWASLRTALRKQRLPSIQESALNKLVQGVTSVEEVVRVTAPRKKAGKPSSADASKRAQPQSAT